MYGRLSSFQKTMLQWDDLHPYNAVHGVRLAGSVPSDRLREALDRALAGRGLTGLSISRREGTYTYRGGAVRSDVRILSSSDCGPSTLAGEVEQQLNTPFRSVDGETFEPFRFFVIPETDAFWLGLAYFHPIADAESIQWLMQGLADAILGRSNPDSAVSLDRYPRCPERMGGWRPATYWRTLASVGTSIRGARRSCRAPVSDPADWHNGFRFFSLGPDYLEAMKAARRSWEVTFNDLVLAVLLQTLSPLSEGRRRDRRRRQIGLGVIVNLRKDLAVQSPGPFGLFLGSFRVGHEVPEAMTLQELAQAVGRQTSEIKRTRSYLATPVILRFARFMFLQFSPERRLRFYSKHYPLWGGVTNMNLNALWTLRPEEGVLDYFRAVSTGPATPLVLSCTTVRDRVNIGLSYRSVAFSEPDIDQVSREFSRSLKQL